MRMWGYDESLYLKRLLVCGKDGFPLTYGWRPLSHLAAHYNKKTTKVSGINP